jgi:CheY-like chemotaxis protein
LKKFKEIPRILANPGVMMRKKLLLAEDSVTIQKVFELVFEKTDISVVAVDNGDDAVRMAAEIAPDLVVADVTLPGKDGFEVASAILEGGSGKEMPVLNLSGTPAPFDEEKSVLRRAGVLSAFETRERLKKWKSLSERASCRRQGEGAGAPAARRRALGFQRCLDEVEETIPARRSRMSPRTGGERSPGAREGGGEGRGGGIRRVRRFDRGHREAGRPGSGGGSGRMPPCGPGPARRRRLEEFEEIEELEEIAESRNRRGAKRWRSRCADMP